MGAVGGGVLDAPETYRKRERLRRGEGTPPYIRPYGCV